MEPISEMIQKLLNLVIPDVPPLLKFFVSEIVQIIYIYHVSSLTLKQTTTPNILTTLALVTFFPFQFIFSAGCCSNSILFPLY